MKIIEVGTGYTSIPAQMGAATEIVVEELAKSFEKLNVNYEIFDIQDNERIKTNLKIREVKVPKVFCKKDVSLGIMHKLKRVVYSLCLAKSLRKEIKESSDSLAIHFHNQYNMYFFFKTTSKKLREKVKVFYTVHSYIWNNKWDKIEGTIRKKYFQEVYCIKHADEIFVLNKITLEHFTKKIGIDINKIYLIDNGVNINIYKPSNNKEKYFIFFQSGSVCDRKNQLEAIKNLTQTLQNNSNYKYLYAGGIIDSDYKKKIDEYVKNNNLESKVEYLGELKPGKEMSKYYNKAKAFIFPSTAEAFSLVIIEALSSGLPVIMKKNSLLDLTDDLKKIILFYNNEDELRKIIKDKIEDEKERKIVSSKSRNIVEKRYSWDSVAKIYISEMNKEFGGKNEKLY